MAKYNGDKVCHIRIAKEGRDIEWITFKKGDEVPKEFEFQVFNKGGLIVEKKEEKKPEPVKKSEVVKKIEKLDNKSKDRVEDLVDDLSDDGKRNYSHKKKKKRK